MVILARNPLHDGVHQQPDRVDRLVTVDLGTQLRIAARSRRQFRRPRSLGAFARGGPYYQYVIVQLVQVT
jgi:hypothetical protein